MRREKRSKKIKIALACVVLIILIVGIILIIKNTSKTDDDKNKPRETEKSIIYDLPSTTYNNMEVTNVELEYLKPNNQTMVTMLIKNTSGKAITSSQWFIVKFLNADGIELTDGGAVIDALDINGETSVSLVLTGDFTSIKKVLIEEPATPTKQKTETSNTTETED